MVSCNYFREGHRCDHPGYRHAESCKEIEQAVFAGEEVRDKDGDWPVKVLVRHQPGGDEEIVIHYHRDHDDRPETEAENDDRATCCTEFLRDHITANYTYRLLDDTMDEASGPGYVLIPNVPLTQELLDEATASILQSATRLQGGRDG